MKQYKAYVFRLYPNYKQKIKEVMPKTIVEIDLGIKDLIVTNDNEKINNERIRDKYERRIRRLQRELSRKVKGSNNYQKAKQKLATIYRKIRNARKHLIHEITNKLVKENDIIVSKTLKVKDMIEEKKISKQLSDVCFSEIYRMLEYKTKLLGKKYIKIDSYYPSSQICSVCGYKNEEVAKDVLKILEGDFDAFKKRTEIYGFELHHPPFKKLIKMIYQEIY